MIFRFDIMGRKNGMEELSFAAVQHLQFVHDFPCASLWVDCSDSPEWAIWGELIEKGYIIECQGYTQCGDDLIESGMGHDITPLGNAYLMEFFKKMEGQNISTIFLSGIEKKILKQMKKAGDREIKVPHEILAPLVMAGVASFKYIKNPAGEGSVAVCQITNTGKRYLQYCEKECVKTWAPIAGSIIVALLGTFIFPLLLG